MAYWRDMYMRHEQMIDRRQQAAQHHLIAQVKTTGAYTNRLHAPLMASLGRRLTLWGRHLETQFGL